MTIIRMAPMEGSRYHPYQSQSQRTACWEEGFVEVPQELLEKLSSCLGYCDLVLENGALRDLLPAEAPPAQAAPPEPGEDRDSLIVDLSYRLTLLELGVS